MLIAAILLTIFVVSMLLCLLGGLIDVEWMVLQFPILIVGAIVIAILLGVISVWVDVLSG